MLITLDDQVQSSPPSKRKSPGPRQSAYRSQVIVGTATSHVENAVTTPLGQ